MAGATNTFETGLAPATVITGANSGGGAGTAFGSNLYISGTGATATFADDFVMHGDLSGKIVLSSSSGASMGFNPGASATAYWTRGYFRFAQVPAGNTTIHTLRDGAVSASGFWLRLQSSGALQVLDRVTFTGVATTPALSVDTWYRVEFYGNINGSWEVWLYEGDSATPLYNSSGSVASTDADKFDFCRWGIEGTGVTNTVWLDDLAWSDEAKIGASEEEEEPDPDPDPDPDPPTGQVTEGNTFETGAAPGTTITGANSGDGNAGTAFGSNFFVAGSGAAVTYADDAVMRGDLAGKIELESSAGASMGFNTGESLGHWTRGYFRFASLPGSPATIHTVRDGAVNTSGFWVRLQAAGTLQVLDRTTFEGVATSPALEVNTWYRLETYFRVNGSWDYWLYYKDDEYPISSASGSVPSTGAAEFDFCRWGADGSSLTGTFWLDDLAWSDTGKIGSSRPAVTAGVPHIFLDTGTEWIDLNTTQVTP